MHKETGRALYTVNPMAVREDVDVYTENKRIVTTIASPEFGRVAVVIIGPARRTGAVPLAAHAHTAQACARWQPG